MGDKEVAAVKDDVVGIDASRGDALSKRQNSVRRAQGVKAHASRGSIFDGRQEALVVERHGLRVAWRTVLWLHPHEHRRRSRVRKVHTGVPEESVLFPDATDC